MSLDPQLDPGLGDAWQPPQLLMGGAASTSGFLDAGFQDGWQPPQLLMRDSLTGINQRYETEPVVTPEDTSRFDLFSSYLQSVARDEAQRALVDQPTGAEMQRSRDLVQQAYSPDVVPNASDMYGADSRHVAGRGVNVFDLSRAEQAYFPREAIDAPLWDATGRLQAAIDEGWSGFLQNALIKGTPQETTFESTVDEQLARSMALTPGADSAAERERIRSRLLAEVYGRARAGAPGIDIDVGGVKFRVDVATPAEFANPAYFIGPGELANVARGGRGLLDASARGARAIAATEFARGEGGALNVVAIKQAIEKLPSSTRERLLTLRDELGDNAATIAHHSDVKKALQDAVAAAGEATSPQNLRDLVRGFFESAPKDVVELSDEEAVREVGKRVAPKPKETPADFTAITSRNTEVKGKYDIVEADTLRTSHDTALRPTADYPSELQPRDRTRAATEQQINDILTNMRPDRLGESLSAGEGAPILDAKGNVLSGNVRGISLRRAYEQEHAAGETYREWLTQNADRFGLDPARVESMKGPVLVRKTDLSGPAAAKFARESNEQTVAAMSASEQARSDAGRLDLAGFTPGEGTDAILSSDNREFVRGFLEGVVSPAERARYVDASGRLSQEGVTRVRNAIFQKAYGDASAIERIAESTDSNVRNIANGLLAAAPKMAVVRDGIEKGTLFSSLDVGKEVTDAMRVLSRLREEGTDVKSFLAQQPLLGRELSPIGEDLLAFFNDNARSSKKIGDFLSRYADIVAGAGHPAQAGLFGENRAPAIVDALERAANPAKTADELFVGMADDAARVEFGRTREAVGGAEPGTNLEQALAKGTSESKLSPEVRAADQAAQDVGKVSPSGDVAIAKEKPKKTSTKRPSGAETRPSRDPGAVEPQGDVAGPRNGDSVTIGGKKGVIEDDLGGGRPKVLVKFEGDDVAHYVKVRDIEEIARPGAEAKGVVLDAPQDLNAAVKPVAEEVAPPKAAAGGELPPPPKPPTAEAAPLPEPEPGDIHGPDAPETTIPTDAGPLDVEKAIAMLDAEIPKTKTIGHKQTLKEAAELLRSGKISADTLLDMAESGAFRSAFNTPEMVAYDALVRANTQDVTKGLLDSGTDAGWEAFDRAVNLKVKWRAVSEEGGRQTEAHKLVAKVAEDAQTNADDIAARVADMLGDITAKDVRTELMGEWRKTIAGIADPAERETAGRQFIQQLVEAIEDQAAVKKELADIPQSQRMNVLRGLLRDATMGNLLGVMTAVKNIVTNEAKVLALISRYAVASALPGSPQRLADLAPGVMAVLHAFGPGAADGLNVIVHGLGKRQLENRFYEGREETLPRVLGAITGKAGKKDIGENIGGALLFGARLSAAGDIFTRTQLEKFYQVTQAAQNLRAKGLSGAKYDAALAGQIAKPRASVKLASERFGRVETWNEARDKIRVAAARAADESVALNAPIDTTIGAMSRLRDVPVIGDTMYTVMPFIATRLNMLDEGLNWSPVGFGRLAKEWRTLTPAERADRMAQTIMGTTALTAAMGTVLGTDNVTGYGPLDDQANLDWQRTHQPYSIRIAGQWVSYRDLGPMTAPIAYVADYADAAKYDGHIPDERTIGASMGHFGRTAFTETGFPENLSNFLETAVSGSEAEWAKFLAGIGRQYIPQSSDLRLARDVLGEPSPHYNSKAPLAQQIIERMRGGLPSGVGGLPPERGVYPRPRTGLRPLLPINTQEANDQVNPNRQPMLTIGGGVPSNAAPPATGAPAGGGSRYVPAERR